MASKNVEVGMNPSERIDSYIAGIADWRREVLAGVRRAMLAADPAVTEDWKWMGSPVWYCGGLIAVANAHKGKVKVTFHKGAHVEDPDHLFNNGLDGGTWRSIDVLEADRLDEAALGRLVKAAIAYNRAHVKGKAKPAARARVAAPSAPEKVARRASPAKKPAKKTPKKGSS